MFKLGCLRSNKWGCNRLLLIVIMDFCVGVVKDYKFVFWNYICYVGGFNVFCKCFDG